MKAPGALNKNFALPFKFPTKNNSMPKEQSQNFQYPDTRKQRFMRDKFAGHANRKIKKKLTLKNVPKIR